VSCSESWGGDAVSAFSLERVGVKSACTQQKENHDKLPSAHAGRPSKMSGGVLE